MKKKIKILSFLAVIFISLSVVVLSSCSKDDDDEPNDPKPIATFQFEVNEMEVTFTNYSQNATSYSWDFGDGETSTDKDPIHTYTDGGTYTVKLTASGNGGSAEREENVTVVKPGGSNLIENGEFDDASIWAIIQHNPNGTGTLSIADGVATYNKGIQGEWGTEPHIGMNQSVTVEAGTYQFDLDITTNGIDEVWFEVWVGSEAPVAEADYNQDNGATKVLAFNTWDCPDNANYSGPMAPVSCQDTDGSIALDAGSYYVVIRSGGITCSADGIIIDNVTMVKID